MEINTKNKYGRTGPQRIIKSKNRNLRPTIRGIETLEDKVTRHDIFYL